MEEGKGKERGKGPRIEWTCTDWKMFAFNISVHHKPDCLEISINITSSKWTKFLFLPEW